MTEILDAVGLGPNLSGISPAVLEQARRRGTIIHEAICEHHYGVFDPAALDPALKGYLAAYERFLADTQHQPIVSEVEVMSRRWGYVGHADRVGWLGPARGLVDWKNTATLDVASVSYQLAAYRLAWNEMHPTEPVTQLLAVQFKPDSTYRLCEVKDVAEAEMVWTAAVVVFNARKVKVG